MKSGFFSYLSLILALDIAALCFILWNRSLPPLSGQVSAPPPVTVVLDAGHGGEDGGTVGVNGCVEKNINLAIVKRLDGLLRQNGVQTRLTRSDDRLLYDPTADYHGRKKALDMAERKRIAEETENALFVSIHMNSYPKPQYKGLQVWYSRNRQESLLLAETIQSSVRRELQPENNRAVKPASSAIYLLHHLTVPAILVECGFLSNPEEADLLSSEAYQEELAGLLCTAILEYLEKNSQKSP